MSDEKAEPITIAVQDAQTSNPSTATNTKSADENPADSALVAVRTKTLQAVVVHQETVIAELERKVQKTRSKVERFEDSTPFIPHHPMSMLHPHNPAAAMAAASATESTMHPRSTTAIPSTPPLCPGSQPLPSHNPTVAAAMAAASAAHPHATGALFAQYPFMFPPADHATMAALMRGVIPPPLQTSQPHPHPPSTTHPPQSSNCPEESEKKQSRYWTQDEHQRFLAAVRAYGPKNYGQISEYVGTRSAKQVRTHAQKYQKKLERDEAREAKRRDEHGVNGHSVGAAAAAAVAAAARAAIHGNVPGAMASHPIHSSPIPPPPPRTGQTSSSSRKNFAHSDHRGAREATARSVDGSSSTNDISRARRTETDSNSAGDGESSHAAAAAAAAAVAAEAANLGGGMIGQQQGSSLLVQVPGFKEDPGKALGGMGGTLETENAGKPGSIVDVDRTATAVRDTRAGAKERLSSNCSSGGESTIRTATTATAGTEKPTSGETENGSESTGKKLDRTNMNGITSSAGKNGLQETDPRRNETEPYTRGSEEASEPNLTHNGKPGQDLANTSESIDEQCQSNQQIESSSLRAGGDAADVHQKISTNCKDRYRKGRASVEVAKGIQERVGEWEEKRQNGADERNEGGMTGSGPNTKGIDQAEGNHEDSLREHVRKGGTHSDSIKSTEMHHYEQVCGSNGHNEVGQETGTARSDGGIQSQKDENRNGNEIVTRLEEGKQLGKGGGISAKIKESTVHVHGKVEVATAERRKRPSEEGGCPTSFDGKRPKVDS